MEQHWTSKWIVAERKPWMWISDEKGSGKVGTIQKEYRIRKQFVAPLVAFGDRMQIPELTEIDSPGRLRHRRLRGRLLLGPRCYHQPHDENDRTCGEPDGSRKSLLSCV